MHRITILLASILILTIIDLNWAVKHHRDHGHHRHEHEHEHEHESLLDKQEREREHRDRKKNNERREKNKNVTCYKCDGDLCRDPFQSGIDIPSTQCEESCWKGVFAATVRRGCGNIRCSFYFKGGSALSNTCCKTSLCNHTPMKIPSIMVIFSMILLTI